MFSLFYMYIVRNDDNEDDQSIISNNQTDFLNI